MKSLFQKYKYMSPKEHSADGRVNTYKGGREWESMYRERWSYDKVVHSTHGVNCTGSCCWNVFVKNGIVTWENQSHSYPSTGPDMPDFEPRGCPRGASFSWYLYSPLRIKYPYVRGELAKLWREAKKKAPNALEAWKSIASDPKKMKSYKEARGMGGFVRSTWDEASEIVAASMLYTAQKYGPDRNCGFSPIPAKSMLSYAAGARFLNLMGGFCLSFYDWYADLPPASPQVWGEQTDVPESSDWYNAGYIMTWGSNVPQTRTPDAHFLAEVRYKGTKVVSVSPDYAESTTFADTWLNVKAGSDAALAMAMGHVILKEYYVDKQTPFFTDYVKQYTDFPFLVTLEEKDGHYEPGRFLTGADMGRTDKHCEFKFYMMDEATNKPVVPNGTMGHRWSEKGKWNLQNINSDTGHRFEPLLSLINSADDVVTAAFPFFGHLDGDKKVLERNIPVRAITLANGQRIYVTTVFDLVMANYGIDRGLGGEAAASYEDDIPFTPAWQEKYTGVKSDIVIHTAREFADNAIETDGRSMIIMGAGINHWYHADIIYRTVLNLVLFCGCEGRNGGGWAHYVGQEKLRPAEGWNAVMTAKDWNPAPRLQQSTSFFYFATDQWRSDAIDTKDLVSPLVEPRYRHSADYNVLAARLGWLPSYPTFNKSGQQIRDEAEKAGCKDFDAVKQFAVNQLKTGDMKFALEDPDAPENFPRNLIVWRSNLITNSSKGHEYFLKYLLGTKNGLFEEEQSPVTPTELKLRDEPIGKLDLLVDLDFRMAGSALYSDVVLPTATWYEKNDLSSTDMHPFIHTFNPAVSPGWESRTDWEIFKTLGKAVSRIAKEANLPVYKDMVAVPLGHDSEQETAQPFGQIHDWKKGECEPIPGKTMPQLVEVNRDYTKIYEKQISLGPNLEHGRLGAHGISFDVSDQYEELKHRNGIIEDKKQIGYGRPSIAKDTQACEAVLTLSSASNGAVAQKAWENAVEATGMPELKDGLAGRQGDRITLDDAIIQPRRSLGTPIFTGNGKDGRRYTPFTNNIEYLVPFRTVTGRQSFYLDHEMMREWGEQLPTYKPLLDYAPLNDNHFSDGSPEITLKFLTPHSKWSIHSMYFDSLQMLTLFRGGQTVWINEDDAAEINVKDNDFMEIYNRNGVVAARAVVTPRIPRGSVYMYHSQDRHINVPGTKLSKTRGGTHNTPTHIHVKPTHMIGGYGQLSYGFNYYGPTGNQRDIFVVVRKMKEVDWLED